MACIGERLSNMVTYSSSSEEFTSCLFEAIHLVSFDWQHVSVTYVILHKPRVPHIHPPSLPPSHTYTLLSSLAVVLGQCSRQPLLNYTWGHNLDTARCYLRLPWCWFSYGGAACSRSLGGDEVAGLCFTSLVCMRKGLNVDQQKT